MKCWKYEVNLPFDECLKPCQGLYVDVKKDAVNIEQETQYEQMMTEYANYTWFQEDNTAPLEGELPKMIIKVNLHRALVSELQHKPSLKFIRIFIESPTFDKITMDNRVKFVDMLSSVGGTMGLLTGFSVISGVEIIYFACKFLAYFLEKQ